MTSTLGDALPAEMKRIRDVVLPEYDKIPTGIFASTLMRAELDRATKALAEGDVVQMLRSYAELKGYGL